MFTFLHLHSSTLYNGTSTITKSCLHQLNTSVISTGQLRAWAHRHNSKQDGRVLNINCVYWEPAWTTVNPSVNFDPSSFVRKSVLFNNKRHSVIKTDSVKWHWNVNTHLDVYRVLTLYLSRVWWALAVLYYSLKCWNLFQHLIGGGKKKKRKEKKKKKKKNSVSFKRNDTFEHGWNQRGRCRLSCYARAAWWEFVHQKSRLTDSPPQPLLKATIAAQFFFPLCTVTGSTKDLSKSGEWLKKTKQNKTKQNKKTKTKKQEAVKQTRRD